MRFSKFQMFLMALVMLIGGLLIKDLLRPHDQRSVFKNVPDVFGPPLSAELRERLRAEVMSGQFSKSLSLGRGEKFTVDYALDPDMQQFVKDYFAMYEPDFGSLVLMNAETGEVLVNFSYQNEKIPHIDGVVNLALQPVVPAGSIFKVVTAAASLDLGRISANSLLPVNGSHHTLYKKNVFSNQVNRWTQFITLRQAFARSINSAFAKIGLHTMKPENLQNYAQKFGFNRTIESDVEKIPEASSVNIRSDDEWNIASVSSGYDHDSRMSALHGAVLASIAINNGIVIKPRFLKSVYDGSGQEIFSSKPDVESIAIGRGASLELRDLMQETIENGTSRRSFRKVAGLRNLDELEMGGKTGSIDSKQLDGRCDWFVGYAKGHAFKIAIAALTVNQRHWKVKSSYLAGKIIEEYYRKSKLAEPHVQQAAQNPQDLRPRDL